MNWWLGHMIVETVKNLPVTFSTCAKQAERLFHVKRFAKNVAQAFSL
jgi:hypothetical protein